MVRDAPRLPVGTQVVLRTAISDADRSVQRGATDRVATDLPNGRYLVRLANGREWRANGPGSHCARRGRMTTG
jgi:hypothetical protein